MSEPYRELIENWSRAGPQRHVHLAGVGGPAWLHRSLRKRQSASCANCVDPSSPKHAPSSPPHPVEEAQVDYGTGPMVRDPVSGKYRRTRLFVLTLGYSRKCVRLLTFQSSTRIWAELHERAFRKLGGTVKIVVLDNLGEGVLKPDIYDATLNPLYRDVLAHYGAVALPCRVADPDRKAYVSYCTSSRLRNDESWLLGLSAALAF